MSSRQNHSPPSWDERVGNVGKPNRSRCRCQWLTVECTAPVCAATPARARATRPPMLPCATVVILSTSPVPGSAAHLHPAQQLGQRWPQHRFAVEGAKGSEAASLNSWPPPAPTTPTARRVPAAGPARESTRHVSVPAGASTAPSRRPRRADRFPPTPRIGEVSGGRAEDIDRETWMWTVRRQTTPGPGGLIDKGTKGKCARTVPLIEEVRPIVAHRLDAASKPDSRLFTGPRGGRISTAALRDALGRGGGHRTRIRASAPPRPTAHRTHLDG
ncbi:hypothetical protein FB564_4391 [Salinispora arenicola]|uniref:Phage integrase family protein n=1 Tax=Salinispora arenicola TaxID=168697 RepID=A0A542XTN3_SALAC|nr:hypothetical protein FB564_4391 [Salinispora arenicola]